MTAQGHYPSLVGSYRTVITPAGDVTISYDFEFGGPEISAQEVGFRFEVPLRLDHLSWVRKGELSWYPKGHIGALSGDIQANSGRPAFAVPTWPYSEDDAPMGSSQHRSTKRHIVSATVKAASGTGWAIQSDGSQYLRAAVESDRIAIFVNDWYGGSPAHIGEYLENYGAGRRLHTGEHVRSTIHLCLLLRHAAARELIFGRRSEVEEAWGIGYSDPPSEDHILSARHFMLTLNGITPVMATCFREDDTIDDDVLRKQIDFAIDAGAAAVCGPGFGAEFYKMSDTERYHFVDVLVEHTRKRVPTIAATSSGSTYSTIEFSRFAEKAGADCVMVTAPRTAPLPALAIIQHYAHLCDALKIPVMLQDADFTGAGLPARVFIELAKNHPNFRFAKLEVLLPGEKCAEIVEQSKGQVQIIYGLGGIAMMDGLAHGASAMMPGAACLEIYVRVYELYQQGRKQEARALFDRLIPYLSFALQHLELAIHIEKRVLHKRGILSSSRMRPPTLTLDRTYEAQMDSLVDSVIALSRECRVQPVAG